MAESELSKTEHVSAADSKEREDRLVWVDERLSEIEYQSYRATTFCVVGIGSAGVVLPFIDANAEFGIELFVRPALIFTGVLMLLLSISLLKKRYENSSLQENAALAGLVFSLVFPSFTYEHSWVGFGFMAAVFLLCATTLVGRRRIMTILIVSVLWTCSIYLLFFSGWNEFIYIAPSGPRSGAGDGLIRVTLALFACFIVAFFYARSQTKINRLLRDTTQAAVYAQAAEKRLLSNMSHEVRNPLNGLLGMLEVLSESTNLDKADREVLSVTMRSGTIIHKLVNEILDYQKMRETGVRIKPEAFDVREAISSMKLGYEAICRKKSITFSLSTKIEDFPHYVLGDQIKIEQLTMNLVDNAIKYTKPGGEVKLLLEYKEGSVIAEISDSGIGMSKETLKKVYERHFQFASSDKAGLGVGLGLAISKAIVEAMEGEIYIESELNVGTVVKVIFPLVAIEDPALEEKGELYTESESGAKAGKELKAHESVSSVTRHEDMTILVVDDQELNLRVMTRLLKLIGVSADCTTSGESALEMLKQKKYDLVITDINMPIMNGIELLGDMKVTHPDTPAIAITGNVLEEDVQKYLSAGFVNVLAKPTCKRDLVCALDELRIGETFRV